MTSDYESAFRIALERALAGFAVTGWTESQFNQFAQHYLMLRKWNDHINLTRIIEPDEAARLHYAESLYGARFVNDARSLIDVGSGAGFPAIPLAIFLPNVQVTALEVNQKKALFLNEVKDTLALANFQVARVRLEEFNASPYDLITSRALDRAESLLPSIIQSLDAEQTFMLFCGPDLLTSLGSYLATGFNVASHPLPQAEARMIALITRI